MNDRLLSNGELQEKVAELKAENERLKEEIKTLEQFLSKEPLALQALQKGYASYKESTNVFYEMVKNYKQTLQEIKAIVEETIIAYTDIAKSNEKLKAFDLRNRLQQILQKITKAEEE